MKNCKELAIQEHYTKTVGGWSMTSKSEYAYDEKYIQIFPRGEIK